MSSRSRASSATTQWTPQTTESLRPVEILGEIATIGDLKGKLVRLADEYGTITLSIRKLMELQGLRRGAFGLDRA